MVKSDRILFNRTSGYKIRYISESDEKIKLYVGEFSETGKDVRSGKPEGRFRYSGIIVIVDGEIDEKIKGNQTLEVLLAKKDEIKTLTDSKPDSEEFIQVIRTILDDSFERDYEFRDDEREPLMFLYSDTKAWPSDYRDYKDKG